MNRKFAASLIFVLSITVLFVQTSFAKSEFNPFHVITSESGDAATTAPADKFSIIPGNNVRVNHDIAGTALVMGNDVVISGNVAGDLIALGKNLILEGNVGGNLYTAGNSVTIRGTTQGDAFAFGSNLMLDQKGAVLRDAQLFGASVVLFGQVGRDAVAYSESFSLQGKVGRDLSVGAETINLEDGSKVGGAFSYESSKAAVIGTGASVTGETKKYVSEEKTTSSAPRKPSPTKGVWDVLFTLGVAFVLWAFFLLVAPRLFTDAAGFLAEKTGGAAGYGAIALVAVPPALLILLCTVIGIPLSVILAVAYGVAVYLGFFIGAGAFGVVMFKRVWKQKDLHKNIWYILAGVLALKLLTFIPFVGWMIWLVATIFGLGIVVLMIIGNRTRQVVPPPIEAQSI